MNTRRELPESPYLAAVAGRKPRRTPVWMMRQAGRSLPEYRALRGKNTVMQACFDPALIPEVPVQPVPRTMAPMGRAQVIMREASGVLIGGSDERGEGSAGGW